MQPLVSIIIPVYNGSNYLAEAIDSALAQTYENIEIIVVNDGSKDDGATERVALSYGEKIRYIEKENGGVSSALNRGIAEMRGEYFSWLSHDDIYKPEKVEKQISLIEDEKDIILCSGALMDANRKPMRHHVKVINKKLCGYELLKEHINGYALNGLGFLIPKIVFKKVGLFDESMRYLQDLDLWLRMMWFDFRFVCHDDILVVSRMHSLQQTNRISNMFNVDSCKLDEKHLQGLMRLESDMKNELLKVYLFRFARAHKWESFNSVKMILRKNKTYTVGVRLASLSYCVKGGVKMLLRKVRDMLLCMKNIRD